MNCQKKNLFLLGMLSLVAVLGGCATAPQDAFNRDAAAAGFHEPINFVTTGMPTDAPADAPVDAAVAPDGPATASQAITWTCTGRQCPFGDTMSRQALVWQVERGAITTRLGYTASETVYLF